MGWILEHVSDEIVKNSAQYKELKKSMVDDPILESYILPKRDEILAINELAEVKAKEKKKEIRNIVAERLNLEEGRYGTPQNTEKTYETTMTKYQESEIERAKKLLQEQGYDVVKKEEINNLK